jgi:DNA-directed RNA polymerase subunit F
MIMVGKEIMEERAVPVSLVRSILEKRSEAGELRYEQRLALAYAQGFTRLELEDANKLANEIADLSLPRVKEEHIAKIVDLLPANSAELNVIFSKDKINLKKDVQDQILAIVDNYRG